MSEFSLFPYGRPLAFYPFFSSFFFFLFLFFLVILALFFFPCLCLFARITRTREYNNVYSLTRSRAHSTLH